MSSHFLDGRDGRARAVLVIVVTGLTILGMTLIPSLPAAAAGYAAEAVIKGSAPANSATEAGWVASCPDIPPSQDVDGHVFELPGPFPAGEMVTAERFESDGPGQPNVGMIFYDGGCNELSRHETSERTTEKTQLPVGTKWVLLTIRQSALAATNTAVCLRIGEAFCRAPTVSPSESTSASGTSSPSPSDSASSGSSPSASRSASAGPSSTTSASPSASPSSGTGTIGTTIESSRGIVRYRKPFALSGRVEMDPGCRDPIEITIRKRRGGSRKSRVLESSVPVGANQTWRVRVRSKVSATYSATATSPTCDSRPPSSVSVRARVAISVAAIGDCTAPQRISGRVKPRHPGTKVTLKRKSPHGSRAVDADELNRRSAYSLTAPTCAGRFTVVWRSQGPENASGRRRLRF